MKPVIMHCMEATQHGYYIDYIGTDSIVAAWLTKPVRMPQGITDVKMQIHSVWGN